MSPAVRTYLDQNDFSGGMVRDVSPSLIPDNSVYDLVDALLDEDGNPYRRGGTAYKSKEGLGTSGLTWAWDGYLRPGHRTVFANSSDFGALGSDDESVVNLGGEGLSAPRQSAVLEELLFIGGAAIYAGSRQSAVYSTGTVKVEQGSKTVKGTGTTWNTLVDAGMLFHIGAGRVYVVDTINSTTELTLRDAYEGTTGEGKTYSLNPVWTIGGSDPYEAWEFLTVCSNRLVVGSGRSLRFTEINNPHTFTNSLGTTNEHSLPEGVQITGLATVGQTVLIFTTQGAWTLDGLALDITDIAGNPQHRLQQLSSDLILAGAVGLAGSGQQIVVPAADGVYLMDGISTPVRISRLVERPYRELIAKGYRPGRAVVFRGHYFLPFLSNSGEVKELFVCRIDRLIRSRSQDSFPWSRFTGDGGEIRAFAVRSVSQKEVILLGAQAREPSRLLSCSAFLEPTSAVKNDADGTTFNFDLITRDFETGNLTENAVRDLVMRYVLVDAAADEPEVKVYWSTGALETGEAKWDEVNWDEFEWGGDIGASFNSTGRNGPVTDDDRTPRRFRVNKKLRYIRFRFVTSGPCAYFALRELKIAIRPSGATRR